MKRFLFVALIVSLFVAAAAGSAFAGGATDNIQYRQSGVQASAWWVDVNEEDASYTYTDVWVVKDQKTGLVDVMLSSYDGENSTFGYLQTKEPVFTHNKNGDTAVLSAIVPVETWNSTGVTSGTKAINITWTATGGSSKEMHKYKQNDDYRVKSMVILQNTPATASGTIDGISYTDGYGDITSFKSLFFIKGYVPYPPDPGPVG
ncbi:MAG: hypothetical protein UT66_C0012G0025 [candidate division CPR2 bacterium GW2011_GWC1_39_9]|uniref:Uncharacterized protein n=1 Tax=candidate division CPR2 bacterium GW2011_GWC2_39_10 TaxID=1618345 RepID=A0A0G0PUA0_UNCC2|nr:MAG: hypothetical protein UT18_C0033G0004 [candidate division CPR2 bacterium GW2011_GWC2_39_10]KKR35184.1 MAG: hypothetical protein UT66_C0012G0025 [candidate division CPR2 bacterium GW2011_GWC1_39_9]